MGVLELFYCHFAVSGLSALVQYNSVNSVTVQCFAYSYPYILAE